MGGVSIRQPKVLHPIDNEDLRILLLENISQDAVKALRGQGWHVDHSTKAMGEDELVDKIGAYHAIGIRSKTKITERVIKAATKVRPLVTGESSARKISDKCRAAAGHRVLLHRNKPGRFVDGLQGGNTRLQFAVLQLALCR